MRTSFAKFLSLLIIASAALALTVSAPASAQTVTQVQIDAAIADAKAGNSATLQTLVGSIPASDAASLTLVGNAVASQLNVGAGAAESNLAAALVSTGNVSLIAGVMSGTNVQGTAQTAVARALVGSPLAQQVATSLAQSGNGNAIVALSVLNGLTGVNAITPVSNITGTTNPVIVPSPAQVTAGSPS